MGIPYSRHYTQFFPPAPTLTPSNLPSQKGKVFLITGGYSGCGYELSKILYNAGGKVYIAGHNEAKAQSAISSIKNSAENASQAGGQLEFLFLELDDLSSIKSSAGEFMGRESRLDVLWNNAGVSQPPAGSVSKQGFELQMAVNALGPYLFTQLLLPILRETAKKEAPGKVRIVWTSSQMVDLAAPTGGLDMNILSTPSKDQPTNYTASKMGNWFLASEFARDLAPHGILSVAQNPGNLKTELMRYIPSFTKGVLGVFLWPVLYEPRMGALTELWAGLSVEIGMRDSGGYVVPWGRMHLAPREDLLSALRGAEEGGTGMAGQFRRWCENITKDYL